jgi:hypothetical protein
VAKPSPLPERARAIILELAKLAAATAALDVDCSQCNAGPGQKCVDSIGPRDAHDKRRDEYVRAVLARAAEES